MAKFNDINVGDYVRSYEKFSYCYIAKCIYKDDNVMEFDSPLCCSFKDTFTSLYNMV